MYTPPGFNLAAANIHMYIWFASYSVVLYDYICTFEAEVAHAWSCPWSIGLALFYLNRYLPVIDIILNLRVTLYPLADCLWTFPLITCFGGLGLIISETIILLRTYAIWGRRALIYWILLFIVIGIFGTMLSLLAWQTAIYFEKNAPLVGKVSSAHVDCQKPAFTFNSQSTLCLSLYYLLAFVGEAIIMTLTVIRAKEHVPRASSVWVNQLYQNGIFYCACMLVLSLLNSSMVFFAPDAYKPVFLPTERALHSVFCNRVLLLVFANRKSRLSGDIETNRSTTYADSTMDVLTSICSESSDTNENVVELAPGTPGLETANREWVQ